eukprot:CAMPEP_0185185866 /NCGR_PEP_ID=MMETSP1140-20130426/3616_1 /TAXON_ID=298111 /ORGANISM="Pavlova sp., Strain CCMP459" /LENGTH=119 /DNA_ID=CAMNT_0027752099 /DNA_START=636 /DNA_END=992 /DNA_ORIENTATION=-
MAAAWSSQAQSCGELATGEVLLHSGGYGETSSNAPLALHLHLIHVSRLAVSVEALEVVLTHRDALGRDLGASDALRIVHPQLVAPADRSLSPPSASHGSWRAQSMITRWAPFPLVNAVR